MILEIEILRNTLDVLASANVPNYNKKLILIEVLEVLKLYPIKSITKYNRIKTAKDSVLIATYLTKVGISQSYGFSGYIQVVQNEIENALSVLTDN